MIQTYRREVTSHTQIRLDQLPMWWDQSKTDEQQLIRTNRFFSLLATDFIVML